MIAVGNDEFVASSVCPTNNFAFPQAPKRVRSWSQSPAWLKKVGQFEDGGIEAVLSTGEFRHANAKAPWRVKWTQGEGKLQLAVENFIK